MPDECIFLKSCNDQGLSLSVCTDEFSKFAIQRNASPHPFSKMRPNTVDHGPDAAELKTYCAFFVQSARIPMTFQRLLNCKPHSLHLGFRKKSGTADHGFDNARCLPLCKIRGTPECCVVSMYLGAHTTGKSMEWHVITVAMHTKITSL